MPLKTFQETLQTVVSLNHGVEWIPESWINAPLYKVPAADSSSKSYNVFPLLYYR